MARIKTKHMKRLDIKLRHLKIAKAIVLEGKSYKDAILAAGYSRGTAYRDQSRMIGAALPTIQDIMEKAGLTPEYIARKLAELAEAKQFSPVTVKNPDGSTSVETWSAPDPRVQQRNMELVTEMEGMRRWGAPGAVSAPSIVQLNVQFGGIGASAAPAGQALPVQVTVTQPHQLAPAPQDHGAPTEEASVEPDSTGCPE